MYFVIRKLGTTLAICSSPYAINRRRFNLLSVMFLALTEGFQEQAGKGDVVLDRVNMEFSDEDNILDEIYQEQVFSDLYFKVFLFNNKR